MAAVAAVRPLVTVQPLEGHMATNALTGVPLPTSSRPRSAPTWSASSTPASQRTAASRTPTGRAASRIPRVPGGGTHRAG
ncbi:hypothetical protein C4D60_Mb02t13610 [Musa balbisiana]|uniref:Uncharacterized protein n=1 Tax=Musa balbisiana TaxID=52838 RepID=A0A4S8ICT3_MUSBA|nr:hypothetical protein C4D60_Mb02t13610 [Musa balbisiana]